MNFAELTKLLFIAVGFSADAFAVAVCKGLAMKKATLKEGAICGAWFGGFQALMPLIGYFVGALFAEAVSVVAPWITFVLLVLIGGSMLKEGLEKGCDCEGHNADLSFKTMFVMAVATSIDALAGGVSLAMDGVENIWLAVTLIGITTFLFSVVGVKVGNVFGCRYEKIAQRTGGVILILLGIEAVLSYFELLPW